MIASLNVENIALIDQLQIDFAEGLNVLSGETGAGKSVLLNALNLILGERAERTLVRHGEERARVEAVVYPDAETAAIVEALDIPYEEELIVTRVLTATGKSVSRINGRAVTLATLRSVMGRLVDLHGQHQHQSLLDPAQHTALLDVLAGSEAASLAERITAEWKALRALEKEREALGGDPQERADHLELLRFQIDEVQEAQIGDDELDALGKERKRLENAEDMKRSLYISEKALKGDDHEAPGVMSGLRTTVDVLKQYEDLDDRLPALVRACEDAYYSLEDAAYTLVSIMDSLEIDERRMTEVDARIEQIRGLLRKYNAANAPKLNALAEEWEKEAQILENADQRAREIESLVESRKKALRGLYGELSMCRRKTADKLTADLIAQLEQLGMENAAFEVRFSGMEDGQSVRYGAVTPETAEFYISVNLGEPLKPLSKVASGGEISRIMLAFKVIAAEHDGIDTLIFDEIDTGISGRTARVVGEKMAQIATARQVIAVTHLPQIAVMADKNFYIHKEDRADRTVTHIDELDAAGIRAEMVRLTGGTVSQNAEAHADEMMAQAKNVKEKLLSSSKVRG